MFIGSSKETVRRYNFCKTDIDLHNNYVTCHSGFVHFVFYAIANTNLILFNANYTPFLLRYLPKYKYVNDSVNKFQEDFAIYDF